MSITSDEPDLALLAAAPRDGLPNNRVDPASIDRRGSDAQMAGKLIAAGADGTVPIQRRCMRLHSGSC